MGKLCLPCMEKTRSLVPAMLGVRFGLGVSTQGGDQVQTLRRVWEPQIEGVVAPSPLFIAATALCCFGQMMDSCPQQPAPHD